MQYQTFSIGPGITLRHMQVTRFKQSVLTVQLVRPMCRAEAAKNALIPTVLLRGSRGCPDLRCITQRLDELYGASVGTLVRRIGDWQTTGLSCCLMDDRFALPGDRVLEPALRFLAQLLLEPLPGESGFDTGFVESERKNLISVIDSEQADKQAYAAECLLKLMGEEDSFGIPRLGEREDVAAITPEDLWAHYRQLLRCAPIEVFYVGSAPAQPMCELLGELFSPLQRRPEPLPPQCGFRACPPRDVCRSMDVAQGKLAMGFLTPITQRDPRFAAMQAANAVFGGGQTSKLFMNVREKQSLCYAIYSGYYGSKGLVTVHAGIDPAREQQVRQEIAGQLRACREGDISLEELCAAREVLLSGLRGVYDSPAAMENYFSTTALNDLPWTPESQAQAISAVTREDVARAAATVEPHGSFFLRGGDAT